MARLLRIEIETCEECPMADVGWDRALGVSDPISVNCTEWARCHAREVAMDIARNGTPDWCPLPEASGWIPVGERLPEPGVRVLVVVEGGWIDVGIRDGDGVRAYSGGRVTHWMPLPSLPEEATDADR
jgi:hypothetical protein